MTLSAVDVIPGALPARPTFLRRLLRHPLAVICIAYLLTVTGVAIAAPIAMPGIAQQGAGDLLHVLAGPSSAHILGTDSLGRDVFERLLVAARTTMLGVAEASLVAMLLGVPIGLAAGYLRGRFDKAVAWATDLALSVPGLIVVLVVVALYPSSLPAAMVAFGAISAPAVARIVRGVTLPIREELYITAAQVSGLSRPYIITRHVLPRIAGVVIVQASLLAAGSVTITAGLAYLGVLNVSSPTWGGMIQDGITHLNSDPWLIWPPGIAVGLTVLAFTLLGDAVRDATTEVWSAPTAQRRSVGRDLQRSRERVTSSKTSLLAVEHLSVSFRSSREEVLVVEDLSFDVAEGETVGIVGESGCGKTTTAMAILGLLPGVGRITAGGIFYQGHDLAALSERELAQFRGKEIGLISQEPMVSLTPTFPVGWQIAQLVRRHHGVSKHMARMRTIELLRQVQLPEPEVVARRYVHELSGGMAQRVAIARALAGDPKLLIADEPTTALDVTVQAEILELLRVLQRSRNMAILLITHNWGVIADLSTRTVVMYAGEVVERAPSSPMFRAPLHPYTEALLDANPDHATDKDVLRVIPGRVPSPGEWPEGCHFHPRCGYATAACRTTRVVLQSPAFERETRCIHCDMLQHPDGQSVDAL